MVQKRNQKKGLHIQLENKRKKAVYEQPLIQFECMLQCTEWKKESIFLFGQPSQVYNSGSYLVELQELSIELQILGVIAGMEKYQELLRKKIEMER